MYATCEKTIKNVPIYAHLKLKSEMINRIFLSLSLFKVILTFD